jgi:hypothetical protein
MQPSPLAPPKELWQAPGVQAVCAYAGLAATDWMTGRLQATAPVMAALRRNSRRFSSFLSFSAM